MVFDFVPYCISKGPASEMSSHLLDPAQILKDRMPTRRFFIGLDSDGCVFDSMERKQKECFCPHFIASFCLQAIAAYAKETWEFVNLYSRTRGCNRYQAVLRTLELLRDHPGVKASGAAVPRMDGLKAWLQHETIPGMATLEAELKRSKNADLELVHRWSRAVDGAVERLISSMPPIPLVRESLEAMRGKADVMVISQTPREPLQREWQEQGLAGLVSFIAGQELGTKTAQLSLATGGKYPAGNILMLGDAPGDLEAARNSGGFFYPITPGHEEASWRRFRKEALDKFLSGAYDGAYQNMLLEEFDAYLPGRPDWSP